MEAEQSTSRVIAASTSFDSKAFLLHTRGLLSTTRGRRFFDKRPKSKFLCGAFRLCSSVFSIVLASFLLYGSIVSTVFLYASFSVSVGVEASFILATAYLFSLPYNAPPAD